MGILQEVGAKEKAREHVMTHGGSGGPRREIAGAKGQWQESRERNTDRFGLATCGIDYGIRLHEFLQTLAAPPAWPRRHGSRRQHQRGAQALRTDRRNHGAKGYCLGAQTQGIGRVFHIAAGKDLARDSKDRGADRKPRIRRVRARNYRARSA